MIAITGSNFYINKAKTWLVNVKKLACCQFSELLSPFSSNQVLGTTRFYKLQFPGVLHKVLSAAQNITLDIGSGDFIDYPDGKNHLAYRSNGRTHTEPLRLFKRVSYRSNAGQLNGGKNRFEWSVYFPEAYKLSVKE
jgi:hypothetical protein